MIRGSKETKWVRYGHRENGEVEYDVKCYDIPGGGPISHELRGERCFRVRTIRNLSHFEEVHQPAYTSMPAKQFLETYEVTV